jgi:hypothetical protein
MPLSREQEMREVLVIIKRGELEEVSDYIYRSFHLNDRAVYEIAKYACPDTPWVRRLQLILRDY